MSELRRLQTFLDFSRLGTIAAVAQETRYSTSAVSQQLDRLEQELGVTLVEPDGRGLRLTSAGELLVERGPQLLALWEQTQSRLRADQREVRGSVRLAGFQTACLTVLPRVLDALHADAPMLRVQSIQAEPDRSLPAVRSREIDVAVVERYQGEGAKADRDTRSTELGRDRMLLVVPRRGDRSATRGATTRGTVLADLAEAPWVLEPKGSVAREWAVRACRAAGFEPRVEHETPDVAVQCGLAAAGVAAAFVPELTPTMLRTGTECVPLAPEHDRSLYAVTRTSVAEDPAVRAVVEALVTATADALESVRR